MGSYLRTNYRITGRELDITALGEAVMQGSWGYAASGPGTRREHGGFIMGSMGGVASVNPTISAYGAMSEYYGDGLFGSGYKIFPIVAYPGDTGSLAVIQWSISATAAANSMIYFRTYRLSASASTFETAAGVIKTGLSGSNVDFVWAGLIVSAP